MTEQEIDDEIKRLEEEAKIDAEIAQLESGLPGIKGPAQESEILEAPADLSGRFAMKAFGTDIQSKLKEYQARNPDKDVMENPFNKGEIIARVKGTSQWLKEDPGVGAWLAYPKEVVSDITDLAVDIPSALVSGAATAKGAIFGTALAPLLGPVAPFAGAVGAGTAASQALEGIRQKIGEVAYGQKMQMPGFGENLAMQALGVSLFGVGVPKNVLKDIASSKPAVAKRGLEKAAKYFIPKGQAATPAEAEMVGEYLSKTITQKGVVPTLTSNVLPLFFGGSKQQLAQAKKPVSQNVLIDLADKINIDPTRPMSQRELVQAATAQGKEAEIGRTALDKIKEATQTAKQKFAERYNEQYGSVTEKPDIRQFKAPIEKRLKDLEKMKSKSAIQEYDALKSIMDQYFTPKDEIAQVPEIVMQNAGGLVDEFGKPIMVPTQVMTQKKVPGSYNFDVPSLQDVSNKLKNIGKIDISYAQKEGMSVPQQLDRGPLLSSAKLIDDKIKSLISDKELPKDYAVFKNNLNQIAPKFETPEKAAINISNAMNDNAKQRALLSELKTFDRLNNTNLEEMAQIAQTAKRFGDPSLEQIGGPGVTSTGRVLRAQGILGAVGSILGRLTGLQTAATAGEAVGQAVGGLGATNWTLNKILAGQEAIGKTPFISPLMRSVQQNPYLYPQQAFPQTWLEMKRTKSSEEK